MFNRISPASFRIRPLDITYIETDNDNHKTTHPGFLIEPEEMLAARLGAKPTNVTAITPEQLEPVQANLVEVFQYLAGNTDFSMVRGPAGEHCCHNIVLLAPPSGPLLPVPYDFDATGVVDPPYAAPALSLHIRDVRQRLYRGYCRPAPALAATLATFRAARADIYALFRGDARLHPGAIDSATTYLDGFYAVIDQPAALQAKVVARCL